jgi:hypothetical protein
MADNSLITFANNPTLWASLKAIYDANHTGWIVYGNENYQVLLPQVPEGEVQLRFKLHPSKDLYLSSSFRG